MLLLNRTELQNGPSQIMETQKSFRKHPLHELFNSFLRHAGKVRVKAIATFRAQALYLASRYFQAARTFKDPGQKDFDSKIQRMIQSECPYLDGYALAKGVINQLGPAHWLFCFTKTESKRTAETLESSLGTALIKAGESLPTINKKAIKADVWQIPTKPPNDLGVPEPFPSGLNLSNYIPNFWPRRLAAKRPAVSGDPKFIELQDEQRAMIQATYLRSNQRLGNTLSRIPREYQ